MTPIRAAACLLAALTLVAPAMAQDVEKGPGPIPYTQLVRREHAARAVHRTKARPAIAAATGASTPGTPPSALVAPPAGLPIPAPSAPPPPPPSPHGAPPAPPPRALAPPAARTEGPPSAPVSAARSKPAPPPPTQLPLAAPLAPPPAAMGGRLAAGQSIAPAELEAYVDGAVRQAMAVDHVAGVTVAVVQNGQVALEKGYGQARLSPAVPVDPRATLFRLGSVSKALTWIEVLKAVEAGRLRLNAPINDALPQGLRLPAEGFRDPVLLKHLMTHAGGFESREFGRLTSADAERLRPLAEALERQRPRRVREPGELSTYSSYGAALAGQAWAETARKPFVDAIEGDLLRAAGLASTTFREPYPARDDLPAPMPAALADRVADGFVWTGAGLARQPFEFAADLAPALSASSTADDMARLMRLMLGDGAPAWGPRTAAALRTTLAPGWAYGMMEYALPGGWRGFGHEGATLAFRAKLLTAPQLGLGVFVAANTDTGDRLVHRLPEALVQRFYGPAAPPAAAAALANPSDYVGLYLSTRRTYHGLEGFVGRLTRLARVRSEDDGRLVIAMGGSARRWRATAAPGRFLSDDDAAEPLTFLLKPDGQAHAFLDPGGMWAAERVGVLHQPATLALAAAPAVAAALLTLAGLFVRNPREYRQSRRQVAASRTQTATAVLWLLAATAFAIFLSTGVEPVKLYRDWPNAWLVGASTLALLATAVTLLQVWQLASVWADDRRTRGWNGGRKSRHTVTTLLSLGLAFVLLAWGALEPWSS